MNLKKKLQKHRRYYPHLVNALVSLMIIIDRIHYGDFNHIVLKLKIPNLKNDGKNQKIYILEKIYFKPFNKLSPYSKSSLYKLSSHVKIFYYNFCRRLMCSKSTYKNIIIIYYFYVYRY